MKDQTVEKLLLQDSIYKSRYPEGVSQGRSVKKIVL